MVPEERERKQNGCELDSLFVEARTPLSASLQRDKAGTVGLSTPWLTASNIISKSFSVLYFKCETPFSRSMPHARSRGRKYLLFSDSW